MMNSSVPPVEARDRFEQAAFDYVSFMLVAARGCVDEPHLYGPLRLVDSVSRFHDLLATFGLGTPFMKELQQHIDRNKFKVMTDPEGFVRSIDEAVMMCARKEVKTEDPAVPFPE